MAIPTLKILQHLLQEFESAYGQFVGTSRYELNSFCRNIPIYFIAFQYSGAFAVQ